MSRRFGSDDDEMQQARARHEQRNQQDWAHDRAQSEEMWIQTERARKMETERGRTRPAGNWQFRVLNNAAGDLTGWRVELNQRLIGMMVLSGDDIQVISAADNPEDPDATEIMAAFIKLYPDPSQRRRLPEGQRVLAPSNRTIRYK